LSFLNYHSQNVHNIKPELDSIEDSKKFIVEIPQAMAIHPPQSHQSYQCRDPPENSKDEVKKISHSTYQKDLENSDKKDDTYLREFLKFTKELPGISTTGPKIDHYSEVFNVNTADHIS
jgi:hypothetical protein